MKRIGLWLVFVFLAGTGSISAAGICADHDGIAEFDQIESSVIAEIQSGYRIYYGHTSHGSQIISGLEYLEGDNPLYDPPVFYERSDDLGATGDTTWVADIRSWLAGHPDYNMVMMSWCGGVSDNTEAGINTYLNKMDELESDYPTVTFVYMTGHLDGTGPDGILYRNNNQIRNYCEANAKVLYDFADIESYDPNGVHYPNESDACGWCTDWCLTHDCCDGYCAHSHCFNCYQKGKAWWWMMATLEGWTFSLDADDDPGDMLPESVRLHQNYPNPFNPSTWIGYELPTSLYVELTVLNLLGQEVRTLVSQRQAAGAYRFEWDGRANNDQPVASGLYFYRLRTGDVAQTRKMLLLK
ncbi:MAG: T9SS type A sorting domain-containing protein [candidate division Zixibacteria bacterium]|nr:T9SS type A sorting domain-containing protein [candidate division Zixibacteria bacterium]